jgi:uncharacterized protein YmfQ (DUF2313 family)
MALNAVDYAEMLLGLLPSGPAWPTDNSQSSRLMVGWAQEFARIDARLNDFLKEVDPRTTRELLSDWERVAGLPDICDETGIALTDDQRRGLLAAKLLSQGGQSAQYYIDVAAALGYPITITEFRPWRCNMRCNLPIFGDDWAYAWQVNAPTITRTYWRCNNQCNEPLSSWGNGLLECVLGKLKPTHTILLFNYGA